MKPRLLNQKYFCPFFLKKCLLGNVCCAHPVKAAPDSKGAFLLQVPDKYWGKRTVQCGRTAGSLNTIPSHYWGVDCVTLC